MLSSDAFTLSRNLIATEFSSTWLGRLQLHGIKKIGTRTNGHRVRRAKGRNQTGAGGIACNCPRASGGPQSESQTRTASIELTRRVTGNLV